MHIRHTHLHNSIKKYIIVDWGTSRFRAFLIDSDSIIIDSIDNDCGIQSIKKTDFQSVLLRHITKWFHQHGPVSVILMGMITSRNGWVEVPYIPCPARFCDIARGAIQQQLPNGAQLLFLPGVCDNNRKPFPDVMRGEETQVVGTFPTKAQTILLPGTHSKWVNVQPQQILGLHTFITGELYAVLTKHAFVTLGAQDIQQPNDRIHWKAFTQGVMAANDDSYANTALSSLLFAARSGVIAHALLPEEVADFISGILIGHEWHCARFSGWLSSNTPYQQNSIVIVGNNTLSKRYKIAANLLTIRTDSVHTNTSVQGALHLSNLAIA